MHYQSENFERLRQIESRQIGLAQPKEVRNVHLDHEYLLIWPVQALY